MLRFHSVSHQTTVSQALTRQHQVITDTIISVEVVRNLAYMMDKLLKVPSTSTN